jgi:hypothetical protein
MNIYALTGHRVTVTKSSISLGTDTYREIAEKHLTVGAVYTVAVTHPQNSYTSVTLQEFPDVLFKSVSFEDVSSQSEADDMKHPDWLTWNTEEGYRKYLEENS